MQHEGTLIENLHETVERVEHLTGSRADDPALAVVCEVAYIAAVADLYADET